MSHETNNHGVGHGLLRKSRQRIALEHTNEVENDGDSFIDAEKHDRAMR
jgi:hypothetical protein